MVEQQMNKDSVKNTVHHHKTGFIIQLLILINIFLCPNIHAQIQQQTDAIPSHQTQTAEIPIIRTVSMNIHYQIENVNPPDLERVELWYGRGLAGAWELSDFDQDKISPVRFVAPAEGIFRFLVIAIDRWGRRSCQSQGIQRSVVANGVPEGIPPHLVVYIDYTSPRLYLYSPRGELTDYTQSELQFRWTGFDSNLTDRPVQLFIQQSQSTEWMPISGPLEADGDYSWKIPTDLKGPIRAQAVLTDRAGNTDIQYSGVIHLSENRSPNIISKSKTGPPETKIAEPNTINPNLTINTKDNQPETSAIPALSSQEIRKRTAQYILRGNLHVERREWPEAITAYEQALDTDPGSVEARSNLAGVLLQTGVFDQAQLHYGLCLDLDDTFTSAWYGLAQAQIALKKYPDAIKSLEKLLQNDPNDFQSWYLHGNVAEQLGLIDIARSSWQKAASDISPVRDLALEALRRTG